MTVGGRRRQATQAARGGGTTGPAGVLGGGGHSEYISNPSKKKKKSQKFSRRLIFRGSRTSAISHERVSLSGSGPLGGGWGGEGRVGEGRGGGGGEDLFDPPTPSPTPSTLPRPLLRRLTFAPSLKRGRWQEVQLGPPYQSQLMGKRGFLEIWQRRRRHPDGPLCLRGRLSSWSERTCGRGQGHLVHSGDAAVGTFSP